MIIDTATPGYSVVIYARRNAPDPDTFDVGPNGWVKVGGVANVHSTQTLRLHTNGASYRYYLVWITDLGAHTSVALNEVALYS